MSTTGDRDGMLQHAKDLRARNRLPEALLTLDRLEALHPRFSRLHQERAHCHVQRRDAPAAIAALHEAVRLNPALPASWDMLAQLYRLHGDARAQAAARQLAILRQLPREVVVADSLLADGDLAPAEAVIRAYLADDAGNVGGLRLLARILMARGAYGEAEAHLRVALDRAPDYHEARLEYSVALLQQQKHALARQEVQALLRHAPDERDYLKQYAAACIGLGDHEPVIDLYERLLARLPPTGHEVAEMRLLRGNALKITGRAVEAIADYRAALGAIPGYGVAWFSLANMKTYRFGDDEIAHMERLLAAAGADPENRIYLSFALAKALEDRGDDAASWRCYASGNALRSAAGSYDAGAASSCAHRTRQTFTADFFAARAGWGVADDAPIFIVGLPRSGSTLVEQILASHAQVEGTQELPQIGRYAAELFGIDPACGMPLDVAAATRLTAHQAHALGQRFLAETRIHRRSGRPFFIDKMPNNFWHIGLIHMILPSARIIDARREPMSCGFSNFKQLFGTANQPFAYRLTDIARYYRDYLDVMEHWDRVLPGRVLRVQHEDMVDDLEGSVRRLLSRCGLAFDPACLAFHENRRSVRTPSSEQVRQPIDGESPHRWRRFARWLAPLHDMLGDAITRYRG